MEGLPPLQCPQQHWHDNGRHKVWMTLQYLIGTQKIKINLMQTICNHVDTVPTGRLSVPNVGWKLRRSQLVYLWAHPSASLPGDVIQHDFLSQHDGPLWPGHRCSIHGGENSQWVCRFLTPVSAWILFICIHGMYKDRFLFFFVRARW